MIQLNIFDQKYLNIFCIPFAFPYFYINLCNVDSRLSME